MVPRFCFDCWLALLLAFTPGVSSLLAQESPSLPRLTFTKTLKGSTPEYFELSIDPNGNATYDSRKLDDPPAPQPVQISSATAAQIFSLAAALDNFQSIDLNSRHKVANMGLKTFTYQAGGQVNKVQYNYTENRTAQQLTDLIEKIGNVMERMSELDYAMKYDPLGLPQILRQIEEGMDNHDLVETDLMLPMLRKITANSRYLHLAQARAQEIIERVQEGK